MSAIERVIDVSEVENLLAQEGAVVELEGNMITSIDPETGIKMNHILVQDEDDGVGAVLFNTIVLKQLEKSELTPEFLLKLLSIENGINTSNFRLIPTKKGYSLVLQNFAKLQNMGEEDVDDVLSTLSYIVEDVAAASRLLEERPKKESVSSKKKETENKTNKKTGKAKK